MCDGNIVYSGVPQGVPNHFAGLKYEFPKFANPADIAMKILSINYPKKDEDEKFVQDLVDNYKKDNAGLDLDLSNKFLLGDVKI